MGEAAYYVRRCGGLSKPAHATSFTLFLRRADSLYSWPFMWAECMRVRSSTLGFCRDYLSPRFFLGLRIEAIGSGVFLLRCCCRGRLRYQSATIGRRLASASRWRWQVFF